MHLKIKALNESLKYRYENHCSYHSGDSGFDLFTPVDVVVPAGAISFKIDLEIQCEAFTDKNKTNNVSYYLYPRSSMGSKTPLRLSNSVGIIDAGYRGNIMAMVDNISQEDFRIDGGSRMFQLCSPILSPVSFQLSDELSETTRGSGGFGSTGF
jgi:dUTP pyrophosphatase